MLNYDVQGQNIVGLAQSTSALNSSQLSYTTSPSNLIGTVGGSNQTLWNYWQNDYYPAVIYESYPIYLRDRAMDKGKHAFEVVKALQDKKLLKLDKVSDFIEAMDCILKTL